MALPAIGDGAYVGDGNLAETLYVGSGIKPVLIGSATGLVGFYGKVPLVQRPFTASVHNTTALASSTDFAAAQLAVVHEIMKTLIGLGIYATV